MKITSPARPGLKAKKSKATIKASVKNVTAKKNIKVKVNKRIVNFTFRNGTVSAQVNLINGENKIEVQATNQSGSASDVSSLIKESRPTIKEQKPQISLTSISSPAGNPFNPGQVSSTIRGTIKNVTKKNQIKILHNGNKLTDFSFNTRTKAFEVVIPIGGNATNKVKITATNSAGSDTKEHTY